MAGKTRVLAIGRTPNFLQYVGIVLPPSRYEVYTAENVSKGLAAMRRVKPVLVVLDVEISYSPHGGNMRREMRRDPDLRNTPLIEIAAVGSRRERGSSPPTNRSNMTSERDVIDVQDPCR